MNTVNTGWRLMSSSSEDIEIWLGGAAGSEVTGATGAGETEAGGETGATGRGAVM